MVKLFLYGLLPKTFVHFLKSNISMPTRARTYFSFLGNVAPAYLLYEKKNGTVMLKLFLHRLLPKTFVHFLKPNISMPTRARNQRNDLCCSTVVLTNWKLHKSHQLQLLPSGRFWTFLSYYFSFPSFLVRKQFNGRPWYFFFFEISNSMTSSQWRGGSSLSLSPSTGMTLTWLIWNRFGQILSKTTAQECETTLSGEKKKKWGAFAQLKTTRPRPHHMCLMPSPQQGLLAECGPVQATIFVNKHANHWERPSGSYPELLYTTAEKQTLCCDSPLVYSDLIEDVHNLSVGQSNCLLSSTVITAAIWRTYNCFCGCWHEEKSFD